MVSRAMMGFILQRLQRAHVDLQKIGIILIGDPAQLLPIGGEPCWSVKLTRPYNKPFNEHSYFGLHEFRSAFGMRNVEDIPGYNLYKKNEKCKNLSEHQRKQVSEFLMNGASKIEERESATKNVRARRRT